MTIANLFGSNVRRLRTERGITQKALAELAGVTASALSSYEKELKSPSLEAAYKIAAALGVSLDELCGGESNKSANRFDTYDRLLRAFVDIDNSISCRMEIDCGQFSLQTCDYEVIQFAQKWIRFRELLNDKGIELDEYETLVQRAIDRAEGKKTDGNMEGCGNVPF